MDAVTFSMEHNLISYEDGPSVHAGRKPHRARLGKRMASLLSEIDSILGVLFLLNP